MSDLAHINYDLDYEKIMVDCEKAKKTRISIAKAETREDRKIYYNYTASPGWRPTNVIMKSSYTSPYIESVMEDLAPYDPNKNFLRPRSVFFWFGPNCYLPEHTDLKAQCSLNFILSGNIAPITISGKEYHYKNALLNTQAPHSVDNGPEERVIFRISFFEPFEAVLERLKRCKRLNLH